MGGVSLEKLHKRARTPVAAALAAGEEVRHWVQGNSHHTMALTDRRVIVVKPGMLAGATFGAKVTSYSLDEISAVEVIKRLGTSWIVIRSAGVAFVDPTIKNGNTDGYKLPNVIPTGSAGAAQDFARAVSAMKEARKGPAQPNPQTSATTKSVADELAKLAALRDQGVLSDEEFTIQKKRLLGA